MKILEIQHQVLGCFVNGRTYRGSFFIYFYFSFLRLFSAPYRIRTCDPRFRNARDSQYTSHRVKYKRSQTLRTRLKDYKLVLVINQVKGNESSHENGTKADNQSGTK